MSFIVLIILLLVFIALFILGVKLDILLLRLIGFCFIIIIIFIGFLSYAVCDTKYIKVEKIKPKCVLKSETSVYVEIEDGIVIFKGENDNITDTTTLYKVTYYNHYGYEIKQDYKKDIKDIENSKIINKIN